jgi:hypothetical protein
MGLCTIADRSPAGVRLRTPAAQGMTGQYANGQRAPAVSPVLCETMVSQENVLSRVFEAPAMLPKPRTSSGRPRQVLETSSLVRTFRSAVRVERRYIYGPTHYESQVTALLQGHIDIAWNSPLTWLDAQRQSGERARRWPWVIPIVTAFPISLPRNPAASTRLHSRPTGVKTQVRVVLCTSDTAPAGPPRSRPLRALTVCHLPMPHPRDQF